MSDKQVIIKKGVNPIVVIILLILLCIGGYMLLHRPKSQLEIVTVVDRTREIARLTTATYSEESAVILRKPRGYHGKQNIVVSRSYASVSMDELCLILKAKVRAGFDLSNLKEQDLEVCPTGDTVTVTLDDVQIFDVTINPSDKTTFSRTGDWTDADERAAYDQIKTLIEREAVEAGLVTRAKKSGEKQITDMFKGFGFTAVNIVYREDGRDEVEKLLDSQLNLILPKKE